MSELHLPLKDHLQDPVDEAAIHRMAVAIDARIQSRSHRRAVPLLVAGAAAVAGVFLFASSRLHRDNGPLVLADGGEVVALDAARTGSELDLSDGSRIWLSPGARFEPLESSGARFSAIVAQGRADFDVRPGGPRHWTVECGLATVEVVGTAFSCERGPGRLRIVVRHGVVLVRGDHVPDRARRLSAGETLDLLDDAPSDVLAGAVPPTGLAAARPGAMETPTPGARPGMVETHVGAAKSWRELARRGRNREAFAVLGSEGLRRESERLGVVDLLALADVARLSGRPAEAVIPLERILAEFSHDPQAPLAAFALGRLELDSLGRSRAAASAFRKAIELGIPRGLREDVLARLVEACARSGDVAAARRAADAYQDEFPNGRHARAIQGWLQR